MAMPPPWIVAGTSRRSLSATTLASVSALCAPWDPRLLTFDSIREQGAIHLAFQRSTLDSPRAVEGGSRSASELRPRADDGKAGWPGTGDVSEGLRGVSQASRGQSSFAGSDSVSGFQEVPANGVDLQPANSKARGVISWAGSTPAGDPPRVRCGWLVGEPSWFV